MNEGEVHLHPELLVAGEETHPIRFSLVFYIGFFVGEFSDHVEYFVASRFGQIDWL